MPLYKIISFFWVIYFLLHLISCTTDDNVAIKSDLSENSFRGKVLSMDSNSSSVRVELLGRSNDLSEKFPGGIGSHHIFQVQPGDFAVLSKKSLFRGKIQETFSPTEGKIYLLHNVWPDDPVERIRVNNINRLLRRNTLSMGDSMIRTVGDNLPPFALYDQNGEVVTTDFFDGSVTVMNFIFSRCSVADMCPAATTKMKKLQNLAEKIKIPHIQFLSITLDPLFDSPGVLKSYARGYSLSEENFRVCTSKKTVIDDLTRQFGILREVNENQPLDHTMRTLIINSRRQIVYQVPGRNWRVEDFIIRLQDGLIDTQ